MEAISREIPPLALCLSPPAAIAFCHSAFPAPEASAPRPFISVLTRLVQLLPSVPGYLPSLLQEDSRLCPRSHHALLSWAPRSTGRCLFKVFGGLCIASSIGVPFLSLLSCFLAEPHSPAGFQDSTQLLTLLCPAFLPPEAGASRYCSWEASSLWFSCSWRASCVSWRASCVSWISVSPAS